MTRNLLLGVIISVALLTALLAGGTTNTTYAAPLAHGGTVQSDGYYGPYHVIVLTNPMLSATNPQITVVVTEESADAADSRPVTGSTVSATYTSTDRQVQPVTQVIAPEPRLGSQGYYEGVFPNLGGGQWQVSISISTPDNPRVLLKPFRATLPGPPATHSAAPAGTAQTVSSSAPGAAGTGTPNMGLIAGAGLALAAGLGALLYFRKPAASASQPPRKSRR